MQISACLAAELTMVGSLIGALVLGALILRLRKKLCNWFENPASKLIKFRKPSALWLIGLVSASLVATTLVVVVSHMKIVPCGQNKPTVETKSSDDAADQPIEHQSVALKSPCGC